MNVTKEMVGSPIDMGFHIYSNISHNDEDAENWTYSKRFGKAVADTKGEASIDARIQKEVLWASDEFKGYQNASSSFAHQMSCIIASNCGRFRQP